MKVNGEAIYGTTASPFEKLSWGRCTRKASSQGTTLYFHIFDWPKNGALVVPGLRNQATSVRLLANGKKLKATPSTDGLVIQLPDVPLDQVSTTVILKVKGKVLIEPAVAAANTE